MLGEIIRLPRGGYLVELSIGSVQAGVPPETLKDTMPLKGGVPLCYCVSDVLFDWNRGLSFCELEFPVYYNYFIRNHKTSIICSVNHVDAVRNILLRGAFGTQDLSLVNDYAPEDQDQVFDILSELRYFREERSLEDLISIEILDELTQSVQKDTCLITKTSTGDFLMSDHNISNDILFVPGRPDHKLIWNTPPEEIDTKKYSHLPQWFAVLPLGTSHGFDPGGRTSGFLFWIQGRGILVDPPAGSTVVLRKMGIDSRLIDSLILTHTHADHDSGILEKLLEEKKIHVYSTHSVFQIWVDKYRHMTGLSEERLVDMMHFHSVYIGCPVLIHGAEFTFSYRLHSVPTVGFSISYHEKKIVYSGDHLNDPAVFESLHSSGIISKVRYDELCNFPWKSDLIYHEAGVPPIHTRLDYLSTLPVSIQKKTFAYHISQRDFEKNSSKLRRAEEHELYCVISNKKIERKKLRRSVIVSLLATADGWEDIPPIQVREYLEKGNVKIFTRGQVVISDGVVPPKLSVIMEGTVFVQTSRGDFKMYGPGQMIALREVVFQKPTIDSYQVGSDEATLFQIEVSVVEDLLQKISLGLEQDWTAWKMLQSGPFCQEMTYRQQLLILDSLQSIRVTSKMELKEKDPFIEGVFLYGDGKIIEGDAVLEGLIPGETIFSLWPWIDDPSFSASSLRRVCLTPGSIAFYLSGRGLRYLYDHQPGVVRRVWGKK